jgi:GTPase SAR1 family protein
MVFMESGNIYYKIVYWGMGGSGKTTIVDTLYKLPKEERSDIEPFGTIKKIARESGATLYFDKGSFHSNTMKSTFIDVFTVAGQSSYSVLRKKVFDLPPPTDGVIFVVDSQIRYLEENLEALRELKSISNGKLIKEIPMVVMLNKQDLSDVIREEDFKQILKNYKLWYESDNKLSLWNPMIYKTCALIDKQKNIYPSFSECARRIYLYQKYGNGKAPEKVDDNSLAKSPKN